MEVKQEGAVAATSMKKVILILFVCSFIKIQAQTTQDSTSTYKKRVLETTEIDFLTSLYSQDGDNAAVTGGIGTEKLLDGTGTLVISVPLNDDDILTIDAGVSAYTSASSSNINPFDATTASPYQASSGASSGDVWTNFTGNYSHSSDDRNNIYSAKLSISSEFDYFSVGFGGSYAKLFNEKNTEISFKGNVYLDTWNPIYPYELRPFDSGGNGLNSRFFTGTTIVGNKNYNPRFAAFNKTNRNSYSGGIGFSQILHKKVQGSLEIDLIKQQGLLSTPFQRVYFADVADSFIDNFHLADAVERLPNSRLKMAAGGRLHWYLNEVITVRSFYRYYYDDWGINSHTASIEIPIKITYQFTLYPSYRFYNQTAATYFSPYEGALSTNNYYTSDYDLSKYTSNQFGFGVSYTDIFAKKHLWKFGLKSIDLKMYQYNRNSSFRSSLITAGLKFVMD